jgi:Peptidase family M1 domain
MNRRGPKESKAKGVRSPFKSLCIRCSKSFVLLLTALLLAMSVVAQNQTASSNKRLRYEIKLAINFDERTYTGTEVVHWVNKGDRATSTIFFHLYSNIRTPDYVAPTQKNDAGQAIADEPRLDIIEVRAVSNTTSVSYSFDDRQTTLRLNLREPLQPGAAVDLQIKFKGSVPEIDPDETGIVTHVLQQVSAAIRSERELRRARDTNFVCRGVMMMATSFPILAARSGDDWLRKVEPSIGDSLTTDAADYNVTIEAAAGVGIFTPVIASDVAHKDKIDSHRFATQNLRDFAIIAGRSLKSDERRVGDITVRSLYRLDHEAIAQRVLTTATNALRIYGEKFGPLPLKTVTIADVPLVSTLGSAEFAGLTAIASAFYVDFDSPTMRNMPDVIRDQRASVEDSLEWTVARVVAHQWWGAAVGNDAGREPVLDESLSNWSALLYYREMHGEQQTATALEEQLRGVYKVYRTFGGDDMEASHSAREYRNSFQYAAIVATKGALMFEALRQLLGEDKFFKALRDYYEANSLEVADMDDLRGAFIAGAPVEQRRAVSRTFDRWLSSKRGDEDIGPPDPKLAEELGLPTRTDAKGDKNMLSPFAKLGKFFWQQMTKIH